MLRARTACHADGCKAWKGASKQQVPEKRLKWQNVAHNRGEFVKHLGRKPTKKTSSLAGTQTLDRQWGWLKSPIPRQLHTHKDCRQDIQKKLEVLVRCSLAQERQRQCPEQPRTALCLKGKRTFRRNPRRTKLLFRACKTLGFPLLK